MWAVVLIGAFYVMTTALGFGARAILGSGAEEAVGTGASTAGLVLPLRREGSRLDRLIRGSVQSRQQLIRLDQRRPRGDAEVAGRQVRHRRLLEDLLDRCRYVGPEPLQPTA